MRECCAIGSVSACAQTLQSFRDAGADEIVLYASTPEENAGLIAAWRQRTQAPVEADEFVG
jgi:hypothetical protein